jgi:hypothetical protein
VRGPCHKSGNKYNWDNPYSTPRHSAHDLCLAHLHLHNAPLLGRASTMSSQQRPEPAHVITIDLTNDVENCWCCYEVIRTRDESWPRFLLVEFGYVG